MRARRGVAGAIGLALAFALAGAPAAHARTAPGPVTAMTSDTGAFRLVQDGREIATEGFTRTADSFAAVLQVRGQATLVTAAALNPDATLLRLEIRVYPEGPPEGEPVQSSAVAFRGGEIHVEQPIGTPVDAPPIQVPAGTLPYLNPSPTFMEQILRRARVVGGDRVDVPLWVPGPGGGQTTQARVVFDGDDASLTFGGVRVDVETDAVGRLLHASVPTQKLVIDRIGDDAA